MNTPRKKGDRGVARSEVVAVRFDPRTKFALELASRSQRRSIANYVEWAVEQSFKAVALERKDGRHETAETAADVLWRLDETHRLHLLKATYPHLLTFEEQRLIELAQRVACALGHTGDIDASAAAVKPHWRFLKEAAAAGMSPEAAAREIRELATGGPMTVDHIDAEIAKRKKDIAWLQAERKRLQVPVST